MTDELVEEGTPASRGRHGEKSQLASKGCGPWFSASGLVPLGHPLVQSPMNSATSDWLTNCIFQVRGVS